MFIPHNDKSIRYIGRWHMEENMAVATACGSHFDIFFKGDHIDLRFCTEWFHEPCPHIYISVDDGPLVESTLLPYLRINTGKGDHKLRVVYKSAVEMHHRWYAPLEGKIAFCGYEAEEAMTAPKSDRKIIEFVGDSITEGVLVDPDKKVYEDDLLNRPFEDDSTATYAWRSAEALGFDPVIMGYGAVGISTSGCGSVPAAPDAYPYCFDGAPIPDIHPDYVFINHGTNDHFADKETFEREYKRLIDVIRTHHPDTTVICMNPFGGYHKESFPCVVEDYNRENNCKVYFIDTTGWAAGMPTHPTRDDHRILGELMTKELKKIIKADH